MIIYKHFIVTTTKARILFSNTFGAAPFMHANQNKENSVLRLRSYLATLLILNDGKLGYILG